MKYIVLVLAFAAFQAMATQKPDHCKPEPKAPVSKPEPKAEPRASRSPNDHDRPCERTIQPVWCKVLK